MIGMLVFGFLLGMRHAVESDHVAAVASLATRARSIRETVPLGVLWGVGHTLTLLAVGSLVLLLDTVVPERLANDLELAVGIMLVLLGADVLYRLYKERVHVHIHRHGDGRVHVHAHSHRGERAPHDPRQHDHDHPRGLSIRALLVGIVHGMAGSAALVLLALQTVESFALGLAYIALFGLGSIIGMAVLSAAIAVPMRYASSVLTGFYNGLKGAVGLATIVLGVATIYRTGLIEAAVLLGENVFG